MEVLFEEGRIRAIQEDGSEAASCSAIIKDGVLYLQDLSGNSPDGVLALVRMAKDLSKIQPVFFPISEGPVYDSLRRIAKRAGANKYIELWRLG